MMVCRCLFARAEALPSRLHGAGSPIATTQVISLFPVKRKRDFRQYLRPICTYAAGAGSGQFAIPLVHHCRLAWESCVPGASFELGCMLAEAPRSLSVVRSLVGAFM